MTSQGASTPTATAEEERAAEERKDTGEEQQDEGIMQRISRLPLPGAGMAATMPAGVPGRVLWWGGLAAFAAFDIVEWPVAVLIGAGEWVAEQYAKEAAQNRRADQSKAASNTPAPRHPSNG